MSNADSTEPQRPPPSVFLSYASEDREAARALRGTLQTYGLEVWYDESGLDGGDAWDQKIRRQIRECDFFMPLISAQTAARPEGYFRREWRLAVERTLDMADDHAFLLPVVIDGTTEARARVPDKFLAVQWTRVPGGQANPALEALCRRLFSGQSVTPPAAKSTQAASAAVRPRPPAREFPEFPREEPGQRLRFGAHVVGWGFRSAWIAFQRLPRWVRMIVYLWLFVIVLSRGCTPLGRHSDIPTPPRPEAPRGVADTPPTDARKIEEIAKNYQGSSDPADLAKLGTQIAQAVTSQVGAELAAQKPLLVIPFGAPSGDDAARKLAKSVFTKVYGRLVISQHGRVSVMGEPPASLDAAAAIEGGRAHHARHVLFGTIDGQSPAQSLTVKLIDVADGSVLWSASYPAATADPKAIAKQVDTKVTTLEEN